MGGFVISVILTFGGQTMLIRLNALPGSKEGSDREILVNTSHMFSAERHVIDPMTVIRTASGTLYVHETLDQIAEKVGGCP
jgi:hypothetical protein